MTGLSHDPTVTSVAMSVTMNATPDLSAPKSAVDPAMLSSIAYTSEPAVSIPAGPVDEAIHLCLLRNGTVVDTLPFAVEIGVPHDILVGVCKSLSSGGFITCENLEQSQVVLTKEGEEALLLGTPEARVYCLVPLSGTIDHDVLVAAAGSAGKVGVSKAVQNKWLEVCKGEGKSKLVSRAVDSILDDVQKQLKSIHAAGTGLCSEELKELKKRKMIEVKLLKSLKVTQGPFFSSWGQKVPFAAIASPFDFL